jgi:hypothetical protein
MRGRRRDFHRLLIGKQPVDVAVINSLLAQVSQKKEPI